ncbi:D-alanyl-D-alanine carboxypeptidase (penicillin-binding protein 5/6) [Dokdonella fugitiva]|jgi:D-alanyl-D-alanine carboxypeptidase (penicillin-binding protein 5/6)|uniref:serine-type D-Ala-D-Ala carboxypeptidase n=1 Tax=Dokdonella fugitiva TaxID=328517 RepID=A0A4R2IFF4_9GAMM|nr:D-alanyl-D-alanine carboxypeptidase (penicillin-binding protein 5/6) [Dokdonella fugitiva]
MKLPFLFAPAVLLAFAGAAVHAEPPAGTQAPAATPALPTPQPVAKPAPAIPVPGASAGPTPPAPAIDAKSWVLMDYASGQVLAESNMDQRVAPASITKVMTSYVVSAEIAHGKIHLEDPVFISERAWRSGGAGTDGSTSFLQLNSKVALKDLLYGMIIQSGNDAAIALAEHTAGSEETFAQLMNQYAAKIGMTGTHYVDASGLPNPDHYTTAHDVALLSRALIHDFPEEYKIYAIKDFEWNGIKQHNRNTLLWRDETVDGIKTGHTSEAGYCLATSAKRGDQRLIAVVMGAPSEKQRADDNQELLNYGFRFFETKKLYAANAPLATPELWKGAVANLPLGISEDVLVTFPRGRYTDLKASLEMPARLVAPIGKGQQVGTLKVQLDDKMLVQRPLIALDQGAEGGFFKRLSDGAWMWFKGDAGANVSSAAPKGD